MQSKFEECVARVVEVITEAAAERENMWRVVEREVIAEVWNGEGRTYTQADLESAIETRVAVRRAAFEADSAEWFSEALHELVDEYADPLKPKYGFGSVQSKVAPPRGAHLRVVR